MKQISLFPVGDTPEHVIEEAIGALPITERNELVAFMEKLRNTVLMEQQKESTDEQ